MYTRFTRNWGLRYLRIFSRLKLNKCSMLLMSRSIFSSRLIAVMGPEDSWVSKWQRVSKYITVGFALS